MTPLTPTILVIDDDPMIGRSLKRLAELSFPDFQAVWTTSGVHGLDLVKQYADRLRLVVLDVHMPLFNGHLVAAQIRALVPHIPILPFSGHREMLPVLSELGCMEPVIKHPALMGDMPKHMRQAMAMPVAPSPNSLLAATLQQSGEAVLAFVNARLPGSVLSVDMPLEGQLRKVCTRLEQYCERFPQPAREVRQALKELREVLS